MTKTSQWFLLLGLTVGLAAEGYAYQREQASQQRRLARISTLADQLRANNQQRAQANTATVRSIAHIVCQNYNQAAYQVILAETQQIQARTQSLLDTVNLLRRRLQTDVASTALANQLPAHFDQYIAFVQRYIPKKHYVLTPFAGERWLQPRELGELPLPAALAALAPLEAVVRRHEARALQTQAEKISSNWDGFDKIGALAVPTTETVAPGGIYQAQLFLAQAGHRDFCNLEMTANGVPLTPPSAPGMQVRFAVPARRPGQPDTVWAHWHGTIRATFFPPDTVLQLDVPYLIVQRPAR